MPTNPCLDIDNTITQAEGLMQRGATGQAADLLMKANSKAMLQVARQLAAISNQLAEIAAAIQAGNPAPLPKPAPPKGK